MDKLLWAPLVESHPEFRQMSATLLARHLSLNFLGYDISPRTVLYSIKRGFLYIKRKAKTYAQHTDRITVEHQNTFNRLFSVLFWKETETHKATQVKRCKEHGDCFTAKRDGETVHIPAHDVTYKTITIARGKAKGTQRQIPVAMIPNVRVYKQTQWIADSEGEPTQTIKERYTVIEQTGKRKELGTVAKALYSTFSENADSIGLRKGVNTRLWFNAIQTKDIMQELSLLLWQLVVAGDEITLDVKRLENYLVVTGRNLLWNSMEKIVLDDDGAPERHSESIPNGKEKRYHFKRSINRIYNLERGDDIRLLVSGEGALIRARDDEED